MCAEDAELVRKWRDGSPNRFALAINNTWELAPWSDVIYGCDHRWWAKYHEQVKQTSAELWAYNNAAVQKFGLRKARLRSTGGNSGYQSIRLAITEFGAERIILLGYDMGATGDTHWHGEHPKGWPTGRKYSQWIEHIRRLGKEFPDVEIINCTRKTALNCFPQMPLEEAFRYARNSTG